MRTCRSFTSLTVCICFLMQIVLQPIAWAKGAAPAVPGTTPVPMRFSATVDPIEQNLIQGFIASIRDQATIYPEFRQQQHTLSATLEQGRPLVEALSTALSDHTDDLAQLNQLQTALAQSSALEERLAAKASQEEGTLVQLLAQASESGAMPDGFLKQTRLLNQSYTWAQDLYQAKAQLVGQYLLTLQELSTALDASAQSILIQQIHAQQQAIGKAADGLDETGQQLSAILARYDQVKADYKTAASTELEEQRQRSAALSRAIEATAIELKQQGDANSLHHGELLELTNRALQERLSLIEQNHVNASELGTQGNILFVPNELGQDNSLGQLAATYRQISEQLIQSTLNRQAEVETLATHLQNTSRAMAEQDQVMDRLDAKALDRQQLGLLAEMRSSQALLRQALGQQIKQMEGLIASYDQLTAPPATIRADQGMSWQVIQLNLGLERVLTELAALRFDQQKINLLGLLAMGDGSLASDADLIAANQELSTLVQQGQEYCAYLQATLRDDQKSFQRLESLAGETLAAGDAIYGQVIGDLDQKLAAIADPESLQTQSLQGTLALLNSRKDQTALLRRAKALQQDQTKEDSTCPSCGPGLTTWSMSTNTGAALVDVLQQLMDVQRIAPLFEGGEQSSFADAKRMFELGSLLHVSVRLQLHDKSLDASYDLGGHVLFVRGIGDPATLLLTKATLPTSTLATYIGGNFFSDAWKSVGGKVNSVVDDAQAVIGQGIDAVVSGAEAVGGAIQTVASVVKGGMKNIVDNAQAIGSYYLDYNGYLLLDDPGQGWSLGNISLWKVGGLALSAGGCILGGVETLGAACIPLIATVANAAIKPGVDRLPIEEQYKDAIKLGLDIGTFIATLASGPLSSIAKGDWSKLSGIGKVLTTLGIHPKSGWDALRNLLTGKGLLSIDSLRKLTDLNALKNLLMELSRSKDLFNAIKSIFGYSIKIKNILEGNGPYGMWGKIRDFIDSLSPLVPAPQAPSGPGGGITLPELHPAPTLNTNQLAPSPELHSTELRQAPDLHTSELQAPPTLNPALMAPIPALQSTPLQQAPDLQTSELQQPNEVQEATMYPMPELHRP